MYVVDLTNETWTLISKQAIILFSHGSWCGSSHPAFEAGGNSFPVAKSNSIWPTLSSFKQTKAAHNDQCCHYGQLIWSGPMCCWFLSFMAIQMCVTASICVTTLSVCGWVSVCVPIQTNGGLAQRAWSPARPLIGIYIGRIINFYFPYYLSVICVNVSRHQFTTLQLMLLPSSLLLLSLLQTFWSL